MEAKEKSARNKNYFDFWFARLNDYLHAAKEEAFDFSARYEDAKFDRNRARHFRSNDRARHFRSNDRDFDVPKLEKAAVDMLVSKLAAENKVEWAETKIADFMRLYETRPVEIDTICRFIERNGIREKLGKAAYQDQYYAMLRAFNRNMAL